ncbi:MAG: bifunctional diaminohydroxyphosphoribosylaminopyrimidine deaminase/5-amino-6-(5-phosphoribosylamino)uracil reductase RibD, partial [Candidatus Micrarchaeota archaeon]|nr:bifunctional diaminohydroxyphosphoribosylaminopyrimidine deaminase/5-amino-6-(5-phosphoribosylamino)uracil reductase RibD [Candidatus Micrarchaeota archaeon]
FGGPHAEVAALGNAGPRAKGATAYVTLEPCCHTSKKTPPCVPALISAGIARVVCAMPDPNSKVSGAGIAQLQKAGVAVTLGPLSGEAAKLNRAYSHFIQTNRPWVTLKTASTLDAKLSASTRWISGKQSRDFVQKIRSEHAAILVGKGTVLADDPQLTCRFSGFMDQPLRVILDARLETPLSAKVYADANTLVLCTALAPKARQDAFRKKGISVEVVAGKNRVDLDAALSALGKRGVAALFVEGGAEVAASFLDAGLVNEGYFFVAPFFSGKKGVPLAPNNERRFDLSETLCFGPDTCLHVLMKSVKNGQNQ